MNPFWELLESQARDLSVASESERVREEKRAELFDEKGYCPGCYQQEPACVCDDPDSCPGCGAYEVSDCICKIEPNDDPDINYDDQYADEEENRWLKWRGY